ncbi:ParB N-terminal domain-containing protein [Citrobacter sp. S2-9]|uniref:ParB N-terminal domain-containing protein n=1 Tax=Citrobacter enshiensis TaxID=2971264 RepID=A0ABT8PVJ3_9ENTR|nr:ParB family protein [Citrobacter enshiensis]MDN8600279.1 ParB N-terminal domain-containing protein [Citrobacter enshiensis]
MSNDQGTLMSVSLDQLRAFDLNPRITRNPNYDDIKESIKARGLDHPPQITQRPGEKYYIVARGGNTRLAILNELWLETHDKKYWNVTCLFCPWPSGTLAQGNLHCLLGHLVENEMRGSLTFIERALAVQKTSEIYQSVSGVLSQTDLAGKLRQDGYPLHQSIISTMTAAVNLLLPHIPELLYGGLSRKSTDRLLTLRSSAGKFWEAQCRQMTAEEEKDIPAFDDIFAMALIPFNGPLNGFSVEHVQDELTGLISLALGIDYNNVALITDASARKRQSLLGTPEPVLPEVSEQRRWQPETRTPTDSSLSAAKDIADKTEHITDASEAGIDTEPDHFDTTVTQPVPGTASGTTARAAIAKSSPVLPVDTIWSIDPVFDDTGSLASLAEQTAWELAGIAGIEHLIGPSPETGFSLAEPGTPLSGESRIYWQLLTFAGGRREGTMAFWRQLLMGTSTTAGLADDAVIRLFQLVRLIRRLHEKQREAAVS